MGPPASAGGPFSAPKAAICLRRPIRMRRRREMIRCAVTAAPRAISVERSAFVGALQARFLSRMRKKAPLTVERKHSQEGFASEQTPHPSSCPPLAADRTRPFRCSSFSHTNRFAGFAWEPCPFAIPLKTTKEEVIPLPWNHPPSEYRRWWNLCSVVVILPL